jgi:ribosomal protein S18 acetylase RimI-like enzyme
MPRPIEITTMPFDDFLVMDHRLGWKHEYFGGAAHLSPAMCLTRFELELEDFSPLPAPLPETYQIRRAQPADKQQLIGLFVDTFEDAIEFVGWNEAAFHESAHQSIATFFGDDTRSDRHLRGVLEYSFVALTNAELVGALEIRSHERGSVIEPVMVHQNHHRLGLGRALLAATASAMQQNGEAILHSRCNLGNCASYAWHVKCGFQEVESYYAANHRAQHYRWRANHFEHAGDSQQAQEMRRQASYWSAIVEKWERSPEEWLARPR